MALPVSSSPESKHSTHSPGEKGLVRAGIPQQFLHLGLQYWDFCLCSISDDFKVNPEIVVDKFVTHPRDCCPLDLLVLFLEFNGNVIDGLSDDFQISNESVLGFGIVKKILIGEALQIVLNSTSGLRNVRDPLEVTPFRHREHSFVFLL